jgi:predicted 2-oxoglutarate/Fe(II)-dependent dioxygenase YbiX
MGIYYFPANFVYWQQVKDHDKIKDVLLKEIYKREDVKKYKHGSDGLYAASTSYIEERNILKNHDQNILKNIVWDPLENAMAELRNHPNASSSKFEESTITDAWYTCYKEGGNFTVHNHVANASDTFSMIYILKDENKDNATVFKEMTNDWISTTSNFISETQFDTRTVKDIKEGSVLIFPSSLYHYVNSVKIPGRITIAINLNSC